MERDFDVAVIGSGSAGTSAAMALRKAGLSVAVIDERPFGGTCALRGCDPKKVLVAAARALDAAAAYADRGIFDRAPQLNWANLMQFKRTFTDPVPEKRVKTYEDAGIAAIRGQARFTGPQALAVDGDTVRAKHIVIATGATELHVASGDDTLLTSETFLELERMPQTLIFVGGGYIAFELAHVASRAGARVTMINDNDKPLHGFDPDAVEQLCETTRNAGIDVQLNTRVERVEHTGKGIALYAQTDSGTKVFEAENGVLAAGRIPDLDHLNLEAAGIERTKKGVKVNERLQSVSNPNVYAAGDCADGGGLPLTPVAGYEGEMVASNVLTAAGKKTDFTGLASMVYTIPPLGQTGLTEAQANEEHVDVEVRAGDMSDWYSTRHLAAKSGFYKVVLEKQSGRILGATIFGPHAEEQINVIALAIRQGLPGRRLAETLFAYPTGSSDMEYFFG